MDIIAKTVIEKQKVNIWTASVYGVCCIIIQERYGTCQKNHRIAQRKLPDNLNRSEFEVSAMTSYNVYTTSNVMTSWQFELINWFKNVQDSMAKFWIHLALTGTGLCSLFHRHCKTVIIAYRLSHVQYVRCTDKTQLWNMNLCTIVRLQHAMRTHSDKLRNTIAHAVHSSVSMQRSVHCVSAHRVVNSSGIQYSVANCFNYVFNYT